MFSNSIFIQPSHLRSGTCDTLNIDVLDGAISKAKLKAQQSIK
jgi:hypothetical protein